MNGRLIAVVVLLGALSLLAMLNWTGPREDLSTLTPSPIAASSTFITPDASKGATDKGAAAPVAGQAAHHKVPHGDVAKAGMVSNKSGVRAHNMSKLFGVARSTGHIDPSDPTCYVFNDVAGRCAPHWVIIGGLKTGTTSVYTWLGKHPNVSLLGDMNEDEEVQSTNWAANLRETRPLQFKEIGYFKSPDVQPDIPRYLRYFPPIEPGKGKMTGEGSVQYIFSVRAAEALGTFMPAARLILLLRDPIERIFSRYQHTSTLFLSKPSNAVVVERLFKASRFSTVALLATQMAVEATALSSLLAAENADACLKTFFSSGERFDTLMSCWISANMATTRTVQGSFSDPARRATEYAASQAADSGSPPDELGRLPFFPALLSTLLRLKSIEHSVYYPQVRSFLSVFTQEQLLIIRSEDLFSHPVETMQIVAEHVDLPPIDWTKHCGVKYNALRDEHGRVTMVPEKSTVPRKYPLVPAVRAGLEAFYQPLNDKLNELVGRDFGWKYAVTAA